MKAYGGMEVVSPMEMSQQLLAFGYEARAGLNTMEMFLHLPKIESRSSVSYPSHYADLPQIPLRFISTNKFSACFLSP
jgi:hypothetical protein